MDEDYGGIVRHSGGCTAICVIERSALLVDTCGRHAVVEEFQARQDSILYMSW